MEEVARRLEKTTERRELHGFVLLAKNYCGQIYVGCMGAEEKRVREPAECDELEDVHGTDWIHLAEGTEKIELRKTAEEMGQT
jgi:hypothetical protein